MRTTFSPTESVYQYCNTVCEVVKRVWTIELRIDSHSRPIPRADNAEAQADLRCLKGRVLLQMIGNVGGRGHCPGGIERGCDLPKSAAAPGRSLTTRDSLHQ